MTVSRHVDPILEDSCEDESEFGFDIKNVTIVTGNAANKVAAFRCLRLSCFAHCLNLVMVDTFAEGQ